MTELQFAVRQLGRICLLRLVYAELALCPCMTEHSIIKSDSGLIKHNFPYTHLRTPRYLHVCVIHRSFQFHKFSFSMKGLKKEQGHRSL